MSICGKLGRGTRVFHRSTPVPLLWKSTHPLLNSGSSSLKFSVYDVESGETLLADGPRELGTPTPRSDIRGAVAAVWEVLQQHRLLARRWTDARADEAVATFCRHARKRSARWPPVSAASIRSSSPAASISTASSASEMSRLQGGGNHHDLDRFHLVIDVLDRVPEPERRVARAIRQAGRAPSYIRGWGTCEIRDWRWDAARP